MSDAKTRYATEEAAAYLGVSIRTLDNYQKAGRLTPGYDADTMRVWKKGDLDAVRASWPHGKKPPGRPPKETQPAETFATHLLKVTKGQSPHEVLAELQLPPGASMRHITAALQRRMAQLVIEHHAIEVLVAGLYSPDAKTRRATAEALLAKVVPNLKAVQMEHTTEESTAHRQERALKVLEEIAAQGRNRQLNHTVRVIEPEDTELVED
jgi:hypothetical protein